MIPVFANAGMIWPKPVTAAGYTGPGDVVASATAWYGLRAYTSASIGANAVRLRESGGNTEQDFVTVTGGGLDLTAISTFKGANNLFVVKLYDQVSTNHLVQATAGNQPEFILNGIGSLPVIRFTGSSHHYLQSGNFGAGAIQPITVVFTAKRTASFTSAQSVASSTNNLLQCGFWTAADTANFYSGGGSDQQATATDNTMHSFICVANGTSGELVIDGSSTAASSNGTTGDFASSALAYGEVGGANATTGDSMEVGFWTSAFNGTQQTNMSSNQHSYWGF